MPNVVVRLYEAIGLVFPPEGAQMPRLDVTAAMPACLICGGFSHMPPAKVGWIGANSKDRRLFLVCSDCGWNATDEALEQRILDKLTSTAEAATAHEVQAMRGSFDPGRRLGNGHDQRLGQHRRPEPLSPRQNRAR